MAKQGENPDFSAHTLNIAEKAQRFFNGTAIGRAITGSDSPAYKQLEWKAQPQLNPNDYEWADEVPGDPKAGRFPRHWHNSALIVASGSEISALMSEPWERGERVQDAAVYQAEGIVRVGTNPDSESDHLFGGINMDNRQLSSVAMRLGRAPLRATLGLWLPDQKELLVPKDVFVFNPLVPADSFGQTGPHEHTPLV